ncbi:hypothetical protein B5X24_HaOG212144 [Helicoverpa armigera]|nr:hypothetical protein B5X24_HaOG212144 [Helicoverpa armigera]
MLQITGCNNGRFHMYLILESKTSNQPESHQFNNMLAYIFSAWCRCQTMSIRFSKSEKYTVVLRQPLIYMASRCCAYVNFSGSLFDHKFFKGHLREKRAYYTQLLRHLVPRHGPRCVSNMPQRHDAPLMTYFGQCAPVAAKDTSPSALAISDRGYS